MRHPTRRRCTVWHPFADELLGHWLEVMPPEDGRTPTDTPDDDRTPARTPRGDGRTPTDTPHDGQTPARTPHDDRTPARTPHGTRTATDTPDDGWYERGAHLLQRYRTLARQHTYCTKHRSPGENLAILRGALEETVAGRPLDARAAGLLRHAVASMVRRRGLPGSERHTALRRQQAAQAALPSHHALAQLVLRRLSELPQETGTADVTPLVAPVSATESRETGLPAGAAIPPAVRQPVETAWSAPIGTLVQRGVVPSAEVLAELVPQLVAVTTAQAYPEEALRMLAAANYRAFRGRRSLLLLNLERQVRVEELPWVRAVSGRRTEAEAGEISALALRQLGELAVQAFPATILPNPLIRELAVLARQAELGAPLVEELAADIFMGTFSPKFLTAAGIAAELLGGGSLYERYYGIDYRAVRNLAIAEAGEAQTRSYGARTSPGFATLCRQRAGTSSSGSWSVAANGKEIEQAQILTTHNLATLVHRVGIAPATGWTDLARRCFVTVCRLTARVHGNPRPLSTVKDAAYAWRQMVFFLSLCTEQDRARTLAWLGEESTRHPAHVTARLAPALTGLFQAAEGRSAEEGDGRRLLGWSTGGHWMLAARRSA